MSQGSSEWHAERLGKVTASRFGCLVSSGGLAKQPKSKADRIAGKMSLVAQSYLAELVAERFTGIPQGFSGNAATQHGTEHEPLARQRYQERTGMEVVVTGFCQSPKHAQVGGSPDGFVGDDGLIEIKCPYEEYRHFLTMLRVEVPAEYIPQIQGLMWITGRLWCDYVSFCPTAPTGCDLWINRVPRDNEYIDNLSAAVIQFANQVEMKTTRLMQFPGG